MNQTQKTQIAEKLQEYIHLMGSQNKAANAIGISGATVNHVVKHNWDNIKADMWRTIAAHLGITESEWVTVQTRDFKLISSVLADAQNNSHVHAIIGNAGTGKTLTLRHYSNNNRNTYLLCCNEYWNKKYFLAELLTSMGRDISGMTVAEMMADVVRALKKMRKPLIIMDEADKLNDTVLYFFITLYNQLEDHCGIVMCATDHLAKVLRRGLKLNKKGYQEIFSRVGRSFIELKGVGSSDVAQICIANGVSDKESIKQVFEDCDNDLRRVKRKVHALRTLMTS
jgi:hypothetical protein